MHGSTYAGRVVSELRVRQQVQGCLIYGLGPTLFEELMYDNGQLLNPNLADYMIPSIVDVPIDITTTAIESNDPDADPHGVGEMTIPQVSPAIASAIFEAVGVRVNDLPITPERLLDALDARAVPQGADDE